MFIWSLKKRVQDKSGGGETNFREGPNENKLTTGGTPPTGAQCIITITVRPPCNLQKEVGTYIAFKKKKQNKTKITLPEKQELYLSPKLCA